MPVFEVMFGDFMALAMDSLVNQAAKFWYISNEQGTVPLVVRSAVGAPITVEGRLWGVMIAASRGAPLPGDAEARLAGFTELVATAVANAESRAQLVDSQAQLTASRARIVTTADATRQRIERDLHDGVQQHLIALRLRTQTAQAMLPSDAGQAAAELDAVAGGLTEVLDELRRLTTGIHPAVLAQGGLRPALRALARRSSIPVRLDATVDERLPEPVELDAPEAAAVLFQMRDGDVGPIVTVPAGFHVIRLVKRTYAGIAPFNEEVQKAIKDKLRNEYFALESKRFLDELKAGARIERFPAP